MVLETMFEIPALENMKEEGFREGSRLEITLKKGAEYNNGWGPAGSSDPVGYEPCDEMIREPGLKMTGYIQNFELEDKRYRKVFLKSVECENPLENHFGRWYVREECIHSFSK